VIGAVPDLGGAAKGATAPGIHMQGAPTQVVENLKKSIFDHADTFISMMFFIL